MSDSPLAAADPTHPVRGPGPEIPAPPSGPDLVPGHIPAPEIPAPPLNPSPEISPPPEPGPDITQPTA